MRALRRLRLHLNASRWAARELGRRSQRSARLLPPLLLLTLSVLVWVVFWPLMGTDRRTPPGPSPARAPQDRIEQLAAAVRNQPTSPDARLRLASAYFSDDRLREALYEFQRAVELDPGNPDAMVGLLTVSARVHPSAETLRLAEEAAAIAPRDPRVLNAVGLAQVQAGRLAAAAQTFDRALALRPDESALLRNAARCAALRGEWRRAEAFIERAAALSSGDPAPSLLWVDLHLQQGWIEQAVEQAEDLSRRYPDSAEVQTALGRTRAARQDWAPARDAFRRAQALRPEWAEPYTLAGLSSMRLRDYDEAVAQYRKALERERGSPSARLALARALEFAGRRDEALALCREVLGAAPDHPVALDRLAYLTAQAGGDLDDALRTAQRAAETHPEPGVARDTLGWLRLMQGDVDGALALLQEAVLLLPSRGLTHYHLGRALLAAGRPGEAARALRTAVARDLPPGERRDAEATLATLDDA